MKIMRSVLLAVFLSLSFTPRLYADYTSYINQTTPIKKQVKKTTKIRKCFPYDKYYVLKKWSPIYVLILAVLLIYLLERSDRKLKKKLIKKDKQINDYERQLCSNCLNQKERLDAGAAYEEYVARVLRRKGYQIEYNGITKGFDDEGIDLICTKADTPTLLVQCKNWADEKTIYENYIFELYGAMEYYKRRNQNQDVEAAFYATCSLSDKAKIIAVELGITVNDKFKILGK